jgi:hypothetical protein
VGFLIEPTHRDVEWSVVGHDGFAYDFVFFVSWP